MRRLVLTVLLLGCGSDPAPDPVSNPLGAGSDLLPYPSSLYEVDDATSPTGVRLDLPAGVFPAPTVSDVPPLDPATLAPRHGWPSESVMIWTTPSGVDAGKLVGLHDIAASVTGDSSTVLLDLTTGERLAHFAEVDANELDHLDRQAVILRPAQRLPSGHRIAAAIRTSLTAPDGKPLPRSRGFQAVLDDRSIGHARLDAARRRLRDAIAALETAGIPRDELVVAWDFTVADDASAIADAVAARDAALAALVPSYTVVGDMGPYDGDPRIARRLDVDFTVPEIANVDGFHRDASGKVIAQGTFTAHATLLVPACATASHRAGIALYGHGFFGSIQELRGTEWIRDVAEDGCFVFGATTWVGMAQDDIPTALLALNDLNKGTHFGEHAVQGVVDMIVFEQLLRGKLATEVLVDAAGHSIVDPEATTFLGVSMGHIMGSVFVALDPALRRAALWMGGANWTMMFERSRNWSVYGLPIKNTHRDALDSLVMEQVLEMGLEPIDGATYAGATVPGTAPKQLLMMTSHDDCAVPNVAAFYQARSLGLDLITPSVITPFGLAQAASSEHGYVIVDERPTPIPPETNEVFSFDNVAHEKPRRRALVQQMLRDFWASGVVHDACNGPCDCAAGNCGELRPPLHGGT